MLTYDTPTSRWSGKKNRMVTENCTEFYQNLVIFWSIWSAIGFGSLFTKKIFKNNFFHIEKLTLGAICWI